MSRSACCPIHTSLKPTSESATPNSARRSARRSDSPEGTRANAEERTTNAERSTHTPSRKEGRPRPEGGDDVIARHEDAGGVNDPRLKPEACGGDAAVPPWPNPATAGGI